MLIIYSWQMSTGFEANRAEPEFSFHNSPNCLKGNPRLHVKANAFGKATITNNSKMAASKYEVEFLDLFSASLLQLARTMPYDRRFC